MGIAYLKGKVINGYSQSIQGIRWIIKQVNEYKLYLLLMLSGVIFQYTIVSITTLFGLENSQTIITFRVLSLILGFEIFVIALGFRIRKYLRVDMKHVRRHLLKEIKPEELESIDQSFELVVLLIGAFFAFLYFALPSSLHIYSLMIELDIIGTFYVTYKIARIKLSIDLRLRIISIGIGSFIMLAIFSATLIPLWILFPMFFNPENIVNTVFFPALLAFLVGRNLYKKRIVNFFDKAVEKLIFTKDCNEKKLLKEQLLYLVKNETIPVVIPLAIGILAISPWLLLPYVEILGSIGVLFLVILILPMYISMVDNQYEIFVYPIGPNEGIEEGPWIPKRNVPDTQLEDISTRVYKMIFGNEKNIEIANEVYTVSKTQNGLNFVQIGDLFFIEQNRRKFTAESKQAKEGHLIMWVFRLRKISAIVNDGNYTDLQTSKLIPVFVAI